MSPFGPAPLRDDAAPSWSAVNQRWLVAEFRRWRQRIETHIAEQASDAAVESAASGEAGGSIADPIEGGPDAAGFRPAALRLAALFGLSRFETELLILTAGIEIDAALAAAVARAQIGPFGQPLRLDFSLALTISAEAHWDALSPLGPLRHWALVTMDASESVMHARLRIDERILHFVTGVSAIDERLAGLIRIEQDASTETSDVAERIVRALGEVREPLVMLSNATLDAPRLAGGRQLARATFARMARRTMWLDPAVFDLDWREQVETIRRLDREAALTDSAIAFTLDADRTQRTRAARLIAQLRGPVILLGALSAEELTGLASRPVFRFNVPLSPEKALNAWPAAVQSAAERALQQFRVDPAVVDQALASVASARSVEEPDANADQAVWDALREAARGGLDTLAQRVESRATLDDLVAPSGVMSQLHEITSQLRHRHRVYEEWGFGERQSRGLGIAALFVGESGTGKTLAAEIIANEAGLDLYRIDLARVVSKFIGETEKNLSHLFDAAEQSGAVLLFDEADALFGKRSEVKDSHDRYANIELAYLLQRIESYRGLAILTTNMKSALDRAFLRRLRFLVQFPFPDQPARVELWRRQFPAQAPIGDVDFPSLARLQLSGGQIRSVALNAAFLAAAQGEPIGHGVLQAAIRAELAKLERPMSELAVGARGSRGLQ